MDYIINTKAIVSDKNYGVRNDAEINIIKDLLMRYLDTNGREPIVTSTLIKLDVLQKINCKNCSCSSNDDCKNNELNKQNESNGKEIN